MMMRKKIFGGKGRNSKQKQKYRFFAISVIVIEVLLLAFFSLISRSQSAVELTSVGQQVNASEINMATSIIPTTVSM